MELVELEKLRLKQRMPQEMIIEILDNHQDVA